MLAKAAEASRVETEQLKIIKMLLDGAKEHTEKLSVLGVEMTKLVESNRVLGSSIDRLAEHFSDGFKKDLQDCFEFVVQTHESSMKEFTQNQVEGAKSTVKVTVLGGVGVISGVAASLAYIIYLLANISNHLLK